MAAPHVNGDVPNSVFLKHVTDYPIVHDGIETFKANPYGQKSIQLSDSAYRTFAAPVLPYFYKPYQYVSPYVKKADDIGDKTLSKIDERWPVVKKPTNELYTDAKGVVLFPLHKTLEGKDHVLSTYQSECKKAGNDNGNGVGVVTFSKAVFATAIIVTTQTLQTVASFLQAKKDEGKAAIDDKVNN